jgi:hypothetical protein
VKNPGKLLTEICENSSEKKNPLTVFFHSLKRGPPLQAGTALKHYKAFQTMHVFLSSSGHKGLHHEFSSVFFSGLTNYFFDEAPFQI